MSEYAYADIQVPTSLAMDVLAHGLSCICSYCIGLALIPYAGSACWDINPMDSLILCLRGLRLFKFSAVAVNFVKVGLI